jgi:archaeosine synthase
MVRTVEAVEGLALLGAARLGDLSFPVPCLAVPSGAAAAPLSLTLLASAGAAPGSRRLTIEGPEARLEIDYVVPTPEVSGVSGGWQSAGPGVIIAHWPLSSDELRTLRDAHPDLVILGNARTLLSEGRPFVEALREIRIWAGAGALLWAPRITLPHRVAFLTYAGVDVLDATESLLTAGADPFEPAIGTLDATAARSEGLPAPLETASGLPEDPAARDGRIVGSLREELALARACLRAGRLRELVEARLTAEPLLAELLRYLDSGAATLLDERAPVLGGPTRTYVLGEALRRPEVARFRARFLERYRPPPSKEVLLLVPCSRTKPYRNSHSHRRFSRGLEELPALGRVHTVSVTSPLGVVPKELEDLPPARHYDIPVTGDWNESERDWVVAAVKHLLAHGHYRSVIAHLDPEEYRFLRPALEAAPDVHWSLSDHRSTAPAALASLRREAEAAVRELRQPPGGPLAVVREELHEIAAMQFGRPAAALLFAPPIRLHGRPWAQRITDGAGVDLATWQETRGLFHLTASGGVRIAPANALCVEVAAEVDLHGDLFTPGVRAADHGIRAGDAVVLVRGAAAVAVGEARMPGRLMTELRRGLAVSIRHRVRSTPDRQAHDTVPVLDPPGPVV